MRNDINKHNTPNLYVKRDKRYSSGYYCQYRDPRFGMKEFGLTKQWRSLGSNVNEAIQKAKTLNAMILPKIVESRLLSIFEEPSLKQNSLLMRNWLKRYTEIQENRLESGEIKPTTWKSKKHIVTKISDVHGHLRIHSINTKTIKTLLDSYCNQGKNRMAQAVRSIYIDIFKEAAASGEVESHFNPALVVKNPIAKVTKSRLSFEQFEQIARAQKYLPHRYSYYLALATAQRRTDICIMRKRKGNDWEDKFRAYKNNPNHFVGKDGKYSFADVVKYAPYSYVQKDHLYIFQLKTGKLLKIPLELKCDALGLNIREIIALCNMDNSSEFVLHHKTARAYNSIGDPIFPDTLTRNFKTASTKANIDWKGSSPATYHEIRSLAERLYREQGIDTKALCGHSDQRMTDRYNDLRGSDWLTIKT